MATRLGESAQFDDTDVITRTVAVLALAALAVIHIVDLPGTLGPTPLVGIGYFAIIAAALLAGSAMIIRSHWLIWAVAAGLAAAAMGGYVLTRSLSGGFLGDHGDVGNWNCPLGIAALSAETLIILLALVRAPRLARAATRVRTRAFSTALPQRAVHSVPGYTRRG